MEKTFDRKVIIRFFLLLSSILLCLQLISCEDDAILEPQKTDDCEGSYCNLVFPNSNDYAAHYRKNPEVF